MALIDPETEGNISSAQIFSGAVDDSIYTQDIAPLGTASEDGFYANEQKILQRNSDDYLSSMYDNATKSNTVAKIANWVGEKIYTEFEDDPEFNVTDDDTLSILKDNGLGIKYAGDIKHSTSNEELDFRIIRALHESNIDDQINTTLTDNERVASSVVGTLADIDMMLGFGVGMMASKSASMAKIMTMEASAEVALSSAHMMFDDNYDLADGIIDATIGTTVAFAATKLVKSFQQNKSEVQAGIDAVTEQYSKEVSSVFGKAVTPKATVGTKLKVVDGKVTFTKAEPSIKEAVLNAGDDVDDAVDLAFRSNSKETIADNRASFFANQSKAVDNIDANRMLDDILIGMDSTIDEVKLNIKANDVEWMAKYKDSVEEIVKLNPKEFEELRDVMKNKINSKTFVDDDIVIGGKKLSAKQKALIAATAIALPSIASGAEGEDIKDELTTIVVGAVILGVLGTKGMKVIKNANFRESIKSMFGSDTIKKVEDAVAKAEYNVSPEKKAIDSATLTLKESIAEASHTALTSTIAPLQKAGGEVAKFAEKLLYSAKNGFGVETVRSQRILAAIGRYKSAEKEAIKQYKKTVRIGGNTKNTFDDISVEKQFRYDVTDYMESRIGDTDKEFPDVVKDFAKVVDKEFDAMYRYNVDNGTYGFASRKTKAGKVTKELLYKEGMIPRLWKGDIHDWIRRADPESLGVVRNALREAIQANMKNPTKEAIKTAEKTADKMIARWVSGSSARVGEARRAESIFDSIESLLKDDTEYEDLLDALNTTKDKGSRAKRRIDMNMDVFFKGIDGKEINIDGTTIKMNKNIFVERDINSIFDKVSTDLYSSGALASAGFKSTRQLEDHLKKLIDSTSMSKANQDLLYQVADILSNKNVFNGSDAVNTASMIAKDVAMSVKLPFAFLSTLQEVMNMVTNHGISKTAKSFANTVLSEHGVNSELAKQLSDTYGTATNLTRHDISYFGISDDLVALEDSGVSNAIRKGTMKVRDTILLPLGAMTDIIERTNSVLDAEMFAKKINGVDASEGYRWSGVTYNENIQKMFSNSFKFNDKGSLEAIDMSKWSNAKKDTYGGILFEMKQRTTLNGTIGETPMASRTDSLMRLVTTLLGYSMSQFNVHSIEGVRHMDRTTFAHSIAGFSGTAIALHLRYALQNKDVSDEKIVMYSMLNTPFLAPVSMLAGASNPVVFELTSGISNMQNKIIGSFEDND